MQETQLEKLKMLKETIKCEEFKSSLEEKIKAIENKETVLKQ